MTINAIDFIAMQRVAFKRRAKKVEADPRAVAKLLALATNEHLGIYSGNSSEWRKEGKVGYCSGNTKQNCIEYQLTVKTVWEVLGYKVISKVIKIVHRAAVRDQTITEVVSYERSVPQEKT